MRERPERDRESSGQPEVSNLEESVCSYQYVLRFQISMHYSFAVALMDPQKDLAEKLFDHGSCVATDLELLAPARYLLRQISKAKLENHANLIELGHDLDQLYEILVVGFTQFFQS